MNPWDTTRSDRLAYGLAIISALAGPLAGVLSYSDNLCAAAMTAIGGLAAGAGIYFSVESSRKRDELVANVLNWQSNPTENNAGFS
jgi:hypothetical protein